MLTGISAFKMLARAGQWVSGLQDNAERRQLGIANLHSSAASTLVEAGLEGT